MNSDSAAIAAFVKTPGLSPVKTRLGASIGRERAEAFFELSVAAIRETLAAATSAARPHWAVAEQEAVADPRWQAFPTLWQGPGTLGDRLQCVMADLQNRFASVLVIGGDSPQLSASVIAEAAAFLTSAPSRRTHVIGRCYDGGFYLFGANYPIAREAWEQAALGTSRAATTLLDALDSDAATFELPKRTDADEVQDLRVLRKELSELVALNSAQAKLLEWLDGATSNWRRRPR